MDADSESISLLPILTKPLSNPTLASEQVSQKELASTSIAPFTAKVLVLGFCAALLVPGVAQFVLFEKLGTLSFPPTRESLQALSLSLDKGSVLKQNIQPKLQELLTRFGGFGNEKVTIGRDGWLYYTPGLRYIFGQPFLDPAYLRAKAKAMIDKNVVASAHPNPLPAFQQLAEDCRRLNIQLMLVPIPDKRMVAANLQNADYDRFKQAVQSYGAAVLPMEQMMETADAPWYLRQDTHWTPRFMDHVARGIADRLQASKHGGPSLYRLQSRSAGSFGDLVAMLKLPADQKLYSAETVQIEEIEPIAPVTAEAEILLLGDSFTNIYSSATLEWGRHAGLGEHLAYHLNAPVDVIAMNGGGATARQELVRAARAGRLSKTRALVYEFAMRDLYLEDWPPLPLGDVPRTPEKTKVVEPAKILLSEGKKPVPKPADSEELTVTGTIIQMSRPINPNSAPYEDALLFAKLKLDRIESGSYSKPDAILVFLAMRNRILQPGAHHSVGDIVRLKLIRLKSAPAAVRNMQRSDDTEDFDLVPYFVQEELR